MADVRKRLHQTHRSMISSRSYRLRSIWLHVVTAIVLALRTLATAQDQPLRHLFLDPAFLAKSEHASLRVNPAQQRETVIRADRPWEQLMISFYLTVLDEGGKIRMWYICRDKENEPNVA